MRKPRQGYQGQSGQRPGQRTGDIQAAKPGQAPESDAKAWAADGRDLETVAAEHKQRLDRAAERGLRAARRQASKQGRAPALPVTNLARKAARRKGQGPVTWATTEPASHDCLPGLLCPLCVAERQAAAAAAWADLERQIAAAEQAAEQQS